MNISGITSEQILKIPELAHLYEAVLFFEKNEGKILFPQKYEASVIHSVERDTCALFEKNPTMSIKEVIVTILNPYSPDIWGELLLKMTQKIIQKWEELSQTVHQRDYELETA